MKKYKSKQWLKTKYYGEKKSTYEVADEVGCAESTIRSWMVRHNLPRRSKSEAQNPNKRYKDRKWLKTKYHMEQLTSVEIANICECNRTTITYWLEKLNISTRKGGPPTKYDIDKRWLKQKYVDEQMSAPEIATVKNCSSTTIYRKLKKFDITIRKTKKENHPNWKGGVTPEKHKIKKCSRYNEWRKSILKRDHYTCQWCDQYGGTLHVDHITPLHCLLIDHQIETLEEAKKCDILWKQDNGRTLCEECHQATPTYGSTKRHNKQELKKLDHQAKLKQQGKNDD